MVDQKIKFKFLALVLLCMCIVSLFYLGYNIVIAEAIDTGKLKPSEVTTIVDEVNLREKSQTVTQYNAKLVLASSSNSQKQAKKQFC